MLIAISVALSRTQANAARPPASASHGVPVYVLPFTCAPAYPRRDGRAGFTWVAVCMRRWFACPLPSLNCCRTVVVVVGPLVYVMDMTDRIISKLCPFIAGGIFIGSVYWTAVTYGAVTVMQVS